MLENNSDAVLKKNNIVIIALMVVFLSICFFQNHKAASEISWGFNVDSYRDMGNIQSIVSDKYGKDPSYLGEYIWYNPLVNVIEAAIVKITNLPVPLVLSKSGVYLNFFAPACFFLMLAYFFNLTIAFASTTGFLFFNINNLPGWAVASYSPWLYPSTFTQAIFYVSLIFLYKAFETEKHRWFILFGIAAGICFLSHTAPTLILVLIMILLTAQKVFHYFKERNFKMMIKYLVKRGESAILFIIFSFPFTYYIVGKYHLHMINTITYEYYDPLFTWFTFFTLIKINFSISLIVAMVGFVFFQYKIANGFNKKIINYWFLVSVFFYVYSSFVSVMGLKYHIHLPGVVPVHHFFFYLKGIQAVMYGFGLYYLFFDGIKWLMKKLNANDSSLKYLNSKYFPWLLFVIVLINYPSYATHKDLTDIDRQTLEINKEPGRFETYHWILQNTDINDVFLGVRDLCDFPVLATGRKMVAVSATFSNAYLDFDKRNNDRIFLLDALKKNKTPQTEKLLDSYSIKYLVIKNSELPFCFFLDDYFPEKVFAGSSISIFKRGLKG